MSRGIQNCFAEQWDSSVWIYLGLQGLDFPLQLFDLLFLLLRLGLGLLPCTELLIKLSEKRNKYVHIWDRWKHTHTGWWAAHCLMRAATGHINSHQNTLSLHWPISIHSSHGPKTLVSSVFVSGMAFINVDGSNLCRNQDMSLQWFQWPSRVGGGLLSQDS